jgi:hypothetical protein
MKIAEFRKYLEVDKGALDDEIVRQPSLFFEVSEAYAEAAATRDGFKDQLATVDAELDAKIRAELGDAKVTESMVKGKVQTAPEHEKAFTDWLMSKERADQFGALKEAFQQRSYMLRDLVSLYTANYYEQNAIKTDASSDALVYRHKRAKLATAREA